MAFNRRDFLRTTLASAAVAGSSTLVACGGATPAKE